MEARRIKSPMSVEAHFIGGPWDGEIRVMSSADTEIKLKTCRIHHPANGSPKLLYGELVYVLRLSEDGVSRYYIKGML